MKKIILKGDLVLINNSRAKNLNNQIAIVKQSIKFDRNFSIVELETGVPAVIKRLGGWAGVAIENQNFVPITGSR